MALTNQKRRYADARLSGMPKKKAAIAAGCPEKTASQAASRYEKDPDIQAAMGRTIAVQAKKAKKTDNVERVEKKDTSSADPAPYIAKPSDDPKVFLTQMMNDLEAEPKLRLNAAKALMPYVHGKIAEQGKKDAKVAAAKEVSQGRFAAGAPPLRSVK